jgi:predicted phosphodiesterase
VRFAVVADVHGRRDHFEAVLSEADRRGVDSVVVGGDYLECLISKRDVGRVSPAGVDEVVDVDPPLWELLARCTLIRGNQEERIELLTRGLPVPDRLATLLAVPASATVSALRVLHGHTFDWSTCDGWWVPTVDDALPDAPVVVFGHSHQALVSTLRTGPDDEVGYQPSPPELGRRIALRSGTRYLVNLAPLRDRPPVWTLYDDDEHTVTFHEAPLRGAR